MTRHNRRWQSDPDEMLQVFSEVTAQARRPNIIARPHRNAAAGLAAGLATGLVASGVVALVIGASAAGPTDQNRVQLPTHDSPDTREGGHPLTVTGGLIEGGDSCIRLTIPERQWLVVWPQGTFLDVSAIPAVIRDKHGQRVTAIGEPFSMSGTSYSRDEADAFTSVLDSPLSEACESREYLLADNTVAALEPRVASWRINPAQAPEAASDSVRVLFREHECAQGFDPRKRLLPPDIAYDAESITITLDVLMIGGRCSDRPEFALTVQLNEAIDNRDLLDGSDGMPRWRPEAGIVGPSQDVLGDTCDELDVGPVDDRAVETQLDRTNGVLLIWIFDRFGRLEHKLGIRYLDASCREHPVIGPIIDDSLHQREPT